MNKIKILHIIQSKQVLSTQGSEEYLFFMLNRELSINPEFEITIISPGYNPLFEQLKNFNIDIHYLDINFKNFLANINNLKKFLLNHSFDIIHTHDLQSDFFIRLLKKKFKNIVFITSRYQVLFSEYMKLKIKLKNIIKILFEKFVINHNDFIICFSDSIKQNYIDIYIPKIKLKKIDPGISTHINSNIDEIYKIRKKVLGVDSNKFKIVCLFGNFNRLQYGFDIYSKIVEYINFNYPGLPVKFAVYGIKNNEKKTFFDYLELKQQDNIIKLIDNYYYPNEVINAVDIIVFPYRYCGLSIPLLKSIKYNKPVIISDSIPFTQIFDKNDNTYVYKPYDYVSFAETIKKIINNKNKTNYNIEKFIKTYSITNMVSKHISLYKKLLY